jgi:hypothetical protein
VVTPREVKGRWLLGWASAAYLPTALGALGLTIFAPLLRHAAWLAAEPGGAIVRVVLVLLWLAAIGNGQRTCLRGIGIRWSWVLFAPLGFAAAVAVVVLLTNNAGVSPRPSVVLGAFVPGLAQAALLRGRLRTWPLWVVASGIGIVFAGGCAYFLGDTPNPWVPLASGLATFPYSLVTGATLLWLDRPAAPTGPAPLSPIPDCGSVALSANWERLRLAALAATTLAGGCFGFIARAAATIVLDGPEQWRQVEANRVCSASAERSASGCTISTCDEHRSLQGGVAWLDGAARASCGETVTVCGHPYRCECEVCSPEPDYPSRMTRQRKAVYKPPDDEKGIILFTVSYQDGKCEGVGDPHYGEKKTCMVSAWDNSHVGGCLRHTNEPSTGEFSCGQSRTVCGGVEVFCECLDAGIQQLRVGGARVEQSEPCTEK